MTLTYFSRSYVKLFENDVTTISGEGSHAGFHIYNIVASGRFQEQELRIGRLLPKIISEEWAGDTAMRTVVFLV